MSTNERILLDYTCESLTDPRFTAVTGTYPNCYLADASSPDTTVEPGTIRLGSGGERGGYTHITFPLPLTEDSLSLTVNMKIESLMTPSALPVWRGLAFEIHIPGSRQLSVVIHTMTAPDKDGSNATIMMMKDDRTDERALRQRIAVPTDGKFHLWDFRFDGKNEMRIYVDGALIVIFSGISLPTNAKDGYLKIGNVMADVESGYNNVVIEHIRLTAGVTTDDTAITDILLPTDASAKSLTVCPEVNRLPENAEITVTVSLKADPAKSVTKTYTPTALASSVTFSDIPFSGLSRITVQMSGALTRTFDYYLYKDFLPLTAEESITDAQPGTAYQFNAMHTVCAQGWTAEHFRHADGTAGSALSAADGASPIPVPVKLNGRFSVYVGCLSGTKNFSVNEKHVFVTNKEDTGCRITERFALAGDFADEEITLSKNDGSAARIAYVKFVSLTGEQYTLYTEKDDSHHLMTDNDGFSMLCYDRKYENPDELTKSVITRYKNAVDQRQFNWATFSTSILNYDSKVWWKYVTKRLEELGIPKENYPRDFMDHVDVNGNHLDFEAKMRDLDKNAYYNMRQLNKIDYPHKILADFVKENDCGEFFVSLRMSHYGFNSYQTGSFYFLHPEWIREGSCELSYAHEEYRNYIHDILMEMAEPENVTGITMDFGRYPLIFGAELTDVCERTRIMTDFVRRVRRDLPGGKVLNARVLNPTADKAEKWGLDFRTWLKEGLIDRLLISDQGHESFFDLTPYADLMKETENAEIYIGINATLSGHDLTKAEEDLLKKGGRIQRGSGVGLIQFMLRAYDAYMAGADGIFIFNGLGTDPAYTNMNNKTSMIKWHEFEYPAYLFQGTAEF